MRPTHSNYAFVLSIALCSTSAFGQDRIDTIREEANAAAVEPNSKQKKAKDARPSSSEDDSFITQLLAGLLMSSDDNDSIVGDRLVQVLFAPFAIPIRCLHDEWDEGSFPPFPYPGRYPAYLWLGDSLTGDRDPELHLQMANARPWSMRIAVEEGNDFNGLNRIGVRALVDTSKRFGLQSNWNFLSESLGGGRHDATVLGDTNLTYRFAQSERVQLYTGLGCPILTDPNTTNLGVNFVYGVDYFPLRPLICSAVFDAGNVGSAAVLHGRGTIGVNKEHVELFAGYDFIRAGSVNIQGPMLGLRFWY